MAHTHTRILVHLVFATAERRLLIVPAIKRDLLGYMAGIARGLACHVHALNRVAGPCPMVVDVCPT